MRFAVLGAGLMGRAVVHDLASSPDVEELLVADFDRARAHNAARQLGRGKARVAFVDVRQTSRLARLLRGADAVVNCAQYYWNVQVMRAAVLARVHYLDLGGLFYMTRQQFRLDRAFRRAKRLALVGMGGAPGITNIMARYLCDRMERVESIRVYNASTDLRSGNGLVSYTFSIATILDELTTRPVAFQNGRFREKPLLSEPEPARFRLPIGPVILRNSLHSELATLPVSFRRKGVREVLFKINYEPKLVGLVRDLTELGFTAREAVAVNGARVSPRALLLALLGRQAPQKPARDVEALRVVVVGREKGHPTGRAMEAWARYSARPELSAVARDTGFPASIAAQMLARGEIRGVGVQAPENVVPPEQFFRELERRNLRLRQWRMKLPAARPG